jgi:hypothetical protein
MPEGTEKEKTQELNVNLLAFPLDMIKVTVFAKMQFSIFIPTLRHVKTAPALFRELFQKFKWLTDRTVPVYWVSPLDDQVLQWKTVRNQRTAAVGQDFTSHAREVSYM